MFDRVRARRCVACSCFTAKASSPPWALRAVLARACRLRPPRMATTPARCRHPLGTRETASHSPDCAPSLRTRDFDLVCRWSETARAIRLTRRGFGFPSPRPSSRLQAAIPRDALRATDSIPPQPNFFLAAVDQRLIVAVFIGLADVLHEIEKRRPLSWIFR